MANHEVYPNPTVKQVVFQIRFPNLFYLESKIGDIQMKIMKEFPESALLYRRQVMIADLGQKAKLEELSNDSDNTFAKKIWKFKSPKGYEMNILSDSLDISSNLHKTYNNPSSDNRFRDIIELVVSQFLKITNLPIISRIGLRYIDHCPIEEKTKNSFSSYYNTSFPLEKFDIAEAEKMDFICTIKKDGYQLRYSEGLSEDENNDPMLILDFDGFANNIDPDEYLKVTDKLHKLISVEYKNTIKQPVIDFMKKENL